MCHFDECALWNQWTGIERQFACQKFSDAGDLVIGDRRRLTATRYDAHHADGLENRQTLPRIEAGEAISREQRRSDLLLAISPSTPASHRREKRLDALLEEFRLDDLLVP